MQLCALHGTGLTDFADHFAAFYNLALRNQKACRMGIGRHLSPRAAADHEIAITLDFIASLNNDTRKGRAYAIAFR